MKIMICIFAVFSAATLLAQVGRPLTPQLLPVPTPESLTITVTVTSTATPSVTTTRNIVVSPDILSALTQTATSMGGANVFPDLGQFVAQIVIVNQFLAALNAHPSSAISAAAAVVDQAVAAKAAMVQATVTISAPVTQ